MLALFGGLARRIEHVAPVPGAKLIESGFVVGWKTLPIRYRMRPVA